MVAKKQLPVGAKSVPKPAAGSGKGRRVVKKKAAAGKAKRTDETEDAADEVPTADEDESLTSRDMEWRMLLASSTKGLVSEKGVSSCGSTVPMAMRCRTPQSTGSLSSTVSRSSVSRSHALRQRSTKI